MRLEVITTGTELLLGSKDDSNATYISHKLYELGFEVKFRTTVGDDLKDLIAALNIGLERSDGIIMTGGLGPTSDDLTRDAVAVAVGNPLEFHPYLLDQIKAFFARLGRDMPDNNKRQAYIPQGSFIIENSLGTAPAFIAQTEDKFISALPGVPREMKFLFEEQVIPYLLKRDPQRLKFKSRILKTFGMGESAIDQHLGDLASIVHLDLGYTAHEGQTDIRLIVKEGQQSGMDVELDVELDRIEAEIRKRLGSAVIARDNESFEQMINDRLKKKSKRIIVIDEILAGKLAARFEKCSEYIGAVSFINESFKRLWLKSGHFSASADLESAVARLHENEADLLVVLLQKTNASYGLQISNSQSRNCIDIPVLLQKRPGGWLVNYCLNEIRLFLEN